MVDGRNLYGHDHVRVQWPALDVNDIPADSIMQIRGGPSQVSGRKISEAKNECTHTFYDPAALRRQDIIVRMPVCCIKVPHSR
jgi:hypothetical protein